MHPVKINLSHKILFVIRALPVQSPISNIVSCSFDSSSISSHQRFSFPPQTDMISPDSPGFCGIIVRQPANTSRQTRKEMSFSYTSLPKHSMAQEIKAARMRLEKIGLVISSFGSKLSCVFGLLVLFETVLCRVAALGLLLTETNMFGLCICSAVT